MNGYQSTEDVEQISRELDQTRADIEETLHTMEQKFSSQYVVDRLHEYIPEGTVSSYVRNLSSAVAANPIPATLMGVSIAWLMFGRNGRSHGVAYETETHEGARLSSAVREKAAAVGERIGAVREKAGSATHQLGAKVEQARMRTRDRVSHMRESVGHMRDSVSNMRARASERGRQIQGTYNWMLQEHPLALGVIGLAVGAVIGATLSETEAENRTLGKARDTMRDRLVEKAGEVAEDVAERAEHAAQKLTGEAQTSGTSAAGYGVASATGSQSFTGGATGVPSSATVSETTSGSERRVEGFT